MFSNPENGDICATPRAVKTEAVVSLFPRPNRPSPGIAGAMQSWGYRNLAVRPRVNEGLGERADARGFDVGKPVDLVNVLRAASQLEAVVDECLRTGLKRLWIQQGIVNEAAAEPVHRSGIPAVMDRCIWRDLNGIWV